MKRRSSMRDCILIFVGLVVTVLGYQTCLNVYSISIGGITGIAVLLNEHLGFSYTITLFALNALLFLWGWKVKGWQYIARSFCAMIALGIALDCRIPLLATLAPKSRTCAMVIGSALTGLGYGAICAANTSTGGSDLLAMIIVKRFPRLTVGLVMDVVDVGVIVATSILEGSVDSLIFSFAAVLICNSLIDLTIYCFSDAERPAWIAFVLRVVEQMRGCIHVFTSQRSVDKKEWQSAIAILAVACIVVVSMSAIYSAVVFSPTVTV